MSYSHKGGTRPSPACRTLFDPKVFAFESWKFLMQKLAVRTKQGDPRDLPSVHLLCCPSAKALADRDLHHIMRSLSVSKYAWGTQHSGGVKTNPFTNSPHQQMNRKRADSSASDASGSSHSHSSNKSKAITTGASKVFNKFILKSLPSTIKSPAEETSTRFQIVHTPDRSPVEMPLSGFPTTNEEFDAAISRIRAQEQLCGSNGSVGQKGVTISSRKGTQQGPHSLRYVLATLANPRPAPPSPKQLRMDMGVADARDNSEGPVTATTSPGSSTVSLGPKGNGPLDKLRRGLETPEPTPLATVREKARPYVRRLASDGVPPRPLSERPLIYSSTRTRPSLQTPHGSISTPNVHSVLPVLRNNSSGKKYGHIRTASGGNTSRRRPRRPPSADSTAASSVEDTDSDGTTHKHRVSASKFTRGPHQKTDDSQIRGPDASCVPNRSKCYFCQEDCQPGDSLCSKCQTRFQPQEEVFDYSESEYEDDIELDDAPHFSPTTDQHPATSPRSLKRRTTIYPRPREKSRGWSEFSSVSQLQHLASRSSSTSPTSHVALELKVVPPQDIKIRTVSSPTKTNAGDGYSALHSIQQVMKPRGSVSPGGQDRDSIRLGKVRSGEIRRVDIPDIIKAKPPTPKEKSLQRNSQEPQSQSQSQSRGSFGDWLRYYDEDDKNSARYSDSVRSTRADAPTGREDSALSPMAGAYDRVTSIYDLYASPEDT